jgi:hypothetical protein
MRATGDLARRLGLTWCGGCGLSATRHRKGAGAEGVIHYADRRLTVQTARTLLLLAAEAERLADPGYLGLDLFDWWYVYTDSIRAYNMGLSAGIRLPRRAFDSQRAECRRMAARRGVALSSRRRVYQWAVAR